jgi:GDP-4-dehydro-6-deoxy-D-mannose reductase
MNVEANIRRVLITGIGGSGGSYLADYLIENHPDIEVYGLARWHSTTQDNLSRISGRIKIHEADLLDFGSVLVALKEVQPDGVFHLAAHANVRASFDTPVSVLNNNIIGTTNLFEAIRLAGLNPLFQMCSTSEVYGQVRPDEVPIKEDAPLRPASPYAVSKVAQDLLSSTYVTSYGMKIIRTRMFSYFNPRRTDLFATSFARQVARIERGLQDELVHGNLDSVRTLIDVRDAMESYWVALRCCDPGEIYNIGGTTTMKVGDVLECLKSLATKSISTRVDPQLYRPTDVTLQIPDIGKFVEKTGWAPKYTFEQSLNHLLDHWRQRIDSEPAER